MKVLLQYLKHKDGTLMSKEVFMKICAMQDWQTLKIYHFFITNDWVFDEDYGFTFDEIVTHMKSRFEMDMNSIQRKAEREAQIKAIGFGEPCEGRR